MAQTLQEKVQDLGRMILGHPHFVGARAIAELGRYLKIRLLAERIAHNLPIWRTHLAEVAELHRSTITGHLRSGKLKLDEQGRDLDAQSVAEFLRDRGIEIPDLKE